MILGAVGILALATGVAGAYAVNNLGALSREQSYDMAHYASYSGIQWGLAQVTKYPRISSPPDTAVPEKADYVGDLGFNSNSELSCKVWIYSNLATANPRWSMAPDGTKLPDGTVYIVSNALFNGNATSRTAQLTALCTPTLFYFNNALLGDAAVKVMNGSILDSFAGGTYPPATFVNSSANVTTNDETTPGAITVDGGSTHVYGGAYYGPSGSAAQVVVSGGAVLDDPPAALNSQVPLKLSKPPGPPITTKANSGLDFHLTSGVTTLTGGTTYVIDGKLIIDPGATLKILPNPSPPVVAPGDTADPQVDDAFIFVKGDIIVKGTLGDFADKPETLQLYVPKQGGGHTFTMDNGKGSFTLAGPDVTALIDNGSEVNGAIIAKSITVDHTSKIHYDNSLFKKPRGPAGWSVGAYNSDHKDSNSNGMIVAPPAPVAPIPGPGPGPGPVPPAPPPTSTTPPSTSGTSNSTQIP
ncbi:hypothetical protein JST97_08220 [bacterium]|nr:hypothetical protein [bacterium]